MRKKIKKPNGVIYFLVYILIYPILKIFFRLKVDRSGYKMPKGPFVVISNHVSFMDFLLVMLTFYPVRLNAVAAQKFFFYRPLNWLLPVMGCIKKNLFDADIRSIIGIKTVLKQGGRALLFPEGRCTVHGTYMGIQKTTGDLLKNLGVPVVSCQIEGAYDCMPFWRKKKIILGRERVTLKNLFDTNELQILPAEKINEKIDVRLSGQLPPPKKPFGVFKANRMTEGLENIIYYCPECESEFTLETKGNIIRCNACGNEAKMDKYSNFEPISPGAAVPKNVGEWYKKQILYEKRPLCENMEPIKVCVYVRMHIHPGKGIEKCGEGTLCLDMSGWRYTGSLRGEKTELFFPLNSVPALPFDPDDNFQIYSEGIFYAFTPSKNSKACAKYATIGECMYWKFILPPDMTPGYDSGFCGE